jgi:hypothetical protein
MGPGGAGRAPLDVPEGRSVPRATGRQSRSASERKEDVGVEAGARTFSFRGRSIEIQPTKEGCCGTLIIDGERVDYVVTDDGIYSHDMAYMTFGSPEELGEELLRQLGQAKISRTPVPLDHDHGQGHDQ